MQKLGVVDVLRLPSRVGVVMEKVRVFRDVAQFIDVIQNREFDLPCRRAARKARGTAQASFREENEPDRQL